MTRHYRSQALAIHRHYFEIIQAFYQVQNHFGLQGCTRLFELLHVLAVSFLIVKLGAQGLVTSVCITRYCLRQIRQELRPKHIMWIELIGNLIAGRAQIVWKYL